VSTPYQRGAAFEYRVKTELESEGYLVTRSPGSKSPLDLLAIRGDGMLSRVVFVQCKLRGVISGADRDRLVGLASQYHAWPVMAYTFKERGLIHYQSVDTRKPWSP
jgi:Holliday junction resolvase